MKRIEELNIYKKASPATRIALMQNGYPVKRKKGEYLFHLRDKVTNVYLVLDGYVVVTRESDDHGTRNIFLLGPGDLVNEVILDGISASVTCFALSDVVVLTYSLPTLKQMMKNDFDFNQYVLRSMTLKIRKLYHMLESSTKTTKLSHQTASRIWKFARDYGVQKDGYIQLPFELRITLLAGFLGSNRETISRIIKGMAMDGILSIEKGVCKIYDMDALRRYGK